VENNLEDANPQACTPVVAAGDVFLAIYCATSAFLAQCALTCATYFAGIPDVCTDYCT